MINTEKVCINQSNDGLYQDFLPIIEFKIPLNLQKYISFFSLFRVNLKKIIFTKEDNNFGRIIKNAIKNPLYFL